MLQVLESEDLDTAWQRRQDTVEEENDKDMLYAFSRIYHGTSGTCVFYFLFWMLKFQILQMSSLKKTDIKLKNGGPQCVLNMSFQKHLTLYFCVI